VDGRSVSDRVRIAAVLVFAAVLFVVGIGRGSLWDQDEAKYTQVAREILLTRDPITLHANGRPWFVHPPLYMWLQALTGRTFGFSEVSARIWSAVFGVVGIYATILVGEMLFGRGPALLAGIVLATTFEYFVLSRLAIFDVVLTAFMLLAFYAFLRAVRTGRSRFRYWAALWVGLGILTKGPIALLLPGLVTAAYLAIRRIGVGGVRAWIGPGVVAAVLGFSWYIIEWARHGWEFVRIVIGYYTVTRFVGVVEGQTGPWWYYAPVFGIGAFPWTAFVLAALPYHIRRRRGDGSLLVLLWIGVTVVFYSLAGTKLPNYVLPAFPFTALSVAVVWHDAFAGQSPAKRVLGIAFAGTTVALIVFAGEIAAFARIKYPDDLVAVQRHLIAVAAALALCLAVAAAAYLARRPRASFAVVAATTVVLAVAVVGRTLPLIDARRPIRPVAEALRRAVPPGETFVGYRISDHQTLLYYSERRAQWVDDPVEVLAYLCLVDRFILAGRPPEIDALLRFAGTRAAFDVRELAKHPELVAIEIERHGSCPVPLLGR
jgi:4-amino-4-deoxy-L-arabinose transferase-like glycosyltransferase